MVLLAYGADEVVSSPDGTSVGVALVVGTLAIDSVVEEVSVPERTGLL